MEHSNIEWTDHTFNPWTGCTKVSPACDHCYAERWAKRAGRGAWGPGETRLRTSEKNWRDPVRWNEQAARLGVRYRMFCASLADVFDNAVPEQWRIDLMKLICETPHLDWLLLTKRIGNAAAMLESAFRAVHHQREGWADNVLPNVWIGATICNQEEADRDIPKLLATPARVRFLSMEPLLGPVDLRRIPMAETCASECCGERRLDVLKGASYCGQCERDPRDENDENDSRVDWVIVGGESGPHARPMHPEWVRALRDQCAAVGAPFLFKQHGEWLATEFCDDDMAMIPSKKTVYVRQDGSFHDGSNGVDFFGGDQETAWVGKKAAGRVLDGRTWDGLPT